MIKNIIKFFLIPCLIIILVIFYLSVFGVKTERFNSQITNNILKINKKINLSLKDVNYLLNPFNLTVNITTKNPQILLDNSKLEIKNIKTNISLKSLFNDEFSIDDLKITTKEIKLKDIILLARSFQNSPELFILDKITNSGFLNAKINLSFDENGKVKKDYKITGSIKKAKFNLLNQYKIKNLNFIFNIEKNKYSLNQVKTKFQNIQISSPLIEIENKKSLFFVKGKISNDNREFDMQELKFLFANSLDNVGIKKIEFSSVNKFSFNINKKLKFNDLKLEANLNLKQLTLDDQYQKLKYYFPNFVNELKFENHKIIINYYKKKLDIRGDGDFLIENKTDSLSYKIIKNNIDLKIDSKINIKNNPLQIDFLNYKKKKNINSLVSIIGTFKENNQINFDLISIDQKNNKILIKGLDLNKNFQIIDLDSFDMDYQNNNDILNKLNLKKENLNFTIKGESFDASKMINNIMDSDEESSSIFENFTSKIDIKIKKTYIDKINYINNLHGNINFDNNKIKDLKLESNFPNSKKIELSIKTNSNSETITRLSSGYPKPLIKRYDFIKGFEGGYLNFYSNKKNAISNSVLTIDDFKVKEVPVFAKLLSLASLQGIADLLTGEGIRFTDFEMNFSNQKGLTTIEEMYAIGPAVSILMDGYIETKKLVSLRGSLVPATTINRSIASIPLLGKILIGNKTGEGVFGVSFKIKGSPKDLKTTVNPIKTLTPRFITRTLEKIKKN